MSAVDLFEEAATLARMLPGPGYRAVRVTRIEAPAGVVTWAACATVNGTTAAHSVDGDGACDDVAAGVGQSPEAALTALCARLRGAR